LQGVNAFVAHIDVPITNIRRPSGKSFQSPHEVERVWKKRNRVTVGFWAVPWIGGIVDRVLSFNQRVAGGSGSSHKWSPYCKTDPSISSAMASAVRSARAAMVSVGLDVALVAKTLEPTIQRFSTSCVRPTELTTDVLGSSPITVVPMM